jgi:hypothetical protein
MSSRKQVVERWLAEGSERALAGWRGSVSRTGNHRRAGFDGPKGLGGDFQKRNNIAGRPFGHAHFDHACVACVFGARGCV